MDIHITIIFLVIFASTVLYFSFFRKKKPSSLYRDGDLTFILHWIKYDFYNLSTRPPEYGTYLVCRKDGKIHFEIWNNSGFAYNNNSIAYWTKIESPLKNN